MRVLPFLVTNNNSNDIITELSEYVSDVDSKLATLALEALGEIAIQVPLSVDNIMDQLLDFMDLDNNYVRTGSTVVIKRLLRIYPDRINEFGSAMCSNLLKPQESTSRASLIWILGQYGHLIPESPYALERVIRHVDHGKDVGVSTELLNACAKLFVRRAPEMRCMFGYLLRSILETDDVEPALHDRAIYIYRTLQVSVTQLQNILGNDILEVPRFPDDNMSTTHSEFNTLSLVYGKRAAEFTNSKMLINGNGSEISNAKKNNETTDLSLNESPVTVENYHSKFKWALVGNIEMKQNVFQDSWNQMDVVQNIQGSIIPGKVSLSTLEQTFYKQHIFTLASGEPNGGIKAFMYGKDNFGNSFFFEFLVNSNGNIQIKVKSEAVQYIQDFCELVNETLGQLGGTVFDE